MKLYKYLLISDALIVKTELLKFGVNDSKGNYVGNPDYVNKFYTCRDYPKSVLMSFRYKNGGDYGEHTTAYTLIDDDDVFRINKDIHDNKHHWNSSNDTEGARQVDELASEQLLQALKAQKILEEGQTLSDAQKVRHKIRTGGYVTSSKLKFHQYLLKTNTKEQPEYVHHHGHTFDNRKEFLSSVSKDIHESIHKRWEPDHNIYRAQKVKIGNFHTTSLNCDCGTPQNNIKLHDCRNCRAVLLIETEQQLKNFFDGIHSQDYIKLKGNFFYKF